MLTVTIKHYINADTPHLASCIMPYFELAEEISEAKDNDIVLDFARCRYLTPALILCLNNILITSRKNITCKNLSSYLQTIGYPFLAQTEQLLRLKLRLVGGLKTLFYWKNYGQR